MYRHIAIEISLSAPRQGEPCRYPLLDWPVWLCDAERRDTALQSCGGMTFRRLHAAMIAPRGNCTERRAASDRGRANARAFARRERHGEEGPMRDPIIRRPAQSHRDASCPTTPCQ
jgi:hypothetical protein